MAMPLLTTKLYTPPPRSQRVPRPRLIERLNAGLRGACKLALISAPAGFGKTSLLSDWLDAPPIKLQSSRIAWLSLDEDDNDLARFFAYLIAALRRIQPDLGDDVLGLLNSPRPPVDEIMPVLINSIGAWIDRAVLVLDDYHVVTAQPIHDAVAFLIDHLPAPLHVIIATRADPPLPLPRWRARNQLLEVRQSDLRFTPDEAADFLRQVMGLHLSAADVAVLTARTEGWIAGLQLAAVSLQDHADIGGFIQSFAGSQRHILDYLVEEVLQRQSADLQTFLLHTSILERLTGPLCDAVLKDLSLQPSALILEQLERANLFVVPLDDRREWYRYHRLFSDLLRHRLQQQQPSDRIADLHRRASAWYAQHDLPMDAIDHAREAGEFDRAADLADQAAPSIWQQGEFGTFLKMMDSLPPAVVQTRPQLCVYHATVLLLGGSSFAKAEALLQAAADRADTDQLRGEVAMLRSSLAMLKGDTASGVEQAEAALRLLPVGDWFYGMALRSLSVIQLLRGDAAAADRFMAESIAASQQIGDRVGLSASLRRMGSLCLLRGQLHKARDFYQRSIDVGGEALGRAWPLAGRSLLHLGELALEWNDLDAAARYLSQALDLLAISVPGWGISGYLAQAQLRQVLGDRAGAQQAIESARQLARESDTALDDVLVEAHAARLALALGDVGTARRWAEGYQARTVSTATTGVDGHIVAEVIQEIEQTVLARVYLATGQIDEALAVLQPAIEQAERRGRGRSAIELRIVQARAFQAHSQPDRARHALQHALTLAEPEGYIRSFVDEGDDVRSLLRDLKTALDDPNLRNYTEQLLAAFGQPDRPPVPNESSLVEPLSDRELDILRLIADGLSNQDIAARLYLALATVKWHAGHIYEKLGVQSRTQAVSKARELGLLPTK